MTGGDDDGPDGGDRGVVSGTPAELFENLLVDEAAPFRKAAMRAGPGRGKGTPNKRTVQMRDLYLRSGFPHPLLWQGSMLRQGIDGLAALLECSLLEAAELLRKIASDAAPYLESRMPLAIEATIDKTPVLVMGAMEAALREVRQARQDGVMAIDDDLQDAMVEHERNQELSADGRATSHDAEAHDGE